MSLSSRHKLPFSYSNKDEFTKGLANWIGDVFYDLLPEQGYEIRDEQIFTALRLADGMCKGRVHLAEAGLGTGKTFAYLLPAIAYARFSGKPVVIACASTALQEQLAGHGGDIDILSGLLNLNIDARMAKDPRQYICDVKVSRLKRNPVGEFNEDLENVLDWADNTSLGERSEMPNIPDKLWQRVAWDDSMACETCLRRGFCKLIKTREHYRGALDLIVADHGFFFADLWTREELIDGGKLPLLPNYSAVIFDEGHKVMVPAAMKAGQQIIKEDLENMTRTLENIQGARTSLISAALAVDLATTKFFNLLEQAIIPEEGAERLAVIVDESLLDASKVFYSALRAMEDQLQFEEELHGEIVSLSEVEIYDLWVEKALIALSRFSKNKAQDVIFWVAEKDGSFWVVPRELREMFGQHLLSQGKPVVFTSATLSTGGDFNYFSRTLGLTNPSVSSVDGSFDFSTQIQVLLNNSSIKDHEQLFKDKIQQLITLLRLSSGRALILTNSLDEVKRIRRALKDSRLPFKFFWEDQGERGYLVRQFREETGSVLVGSGFWEGIDIPGEALSLLIIWQLPFPTKDPLIEAQRLVAKKQGLDPLVAVDYPEMGLKLKQGCGRLIRVSSDQGLIAIIEPVIGKPWEEVVRGALPLDAPVVDAIDNITVFKTN